MHPDLRLLVLVAAWAPDMSENTRRTFGWYRRDVLDRFASADKIIAFNHGSATAMHDILLGTDNVINSCIVEPEMHIDSDAAPYQAALKLARPIVGNYDAVLFVHTKGVSHNFALYDAIRQALTRDFFKNPKLLEELSSSNPRFVCYRAHMDSYKHSIRALEMFSERIGITLPTFSFGATYTVFGTTTQALRLFFDQMPPWFLDQSISSWGGNRFLFEGLFPSLLVSLGADLRLIGQCQTNPALNADMSYGCDPQHTNSVTERAYRSYRNEGVNYRQSPIPFVHDHPDVAMKLNVAFAC